MNAALMKTNMNEASAVGETEPAAQLPHPIPYQGSKRSLASRILATVNGRHFERLFEPFAGSAAITLASASRALADSYVLGDSLTSLMALWRMITREPERLATGYSDIWHGQHDANPDYFFQIRELFNAEGGEARLLYLLARCVKNAPRFNGQGGFNQSHDKRRLGMRPEKMAREIHGAFVLLRDTVELVFGDFEQCLADASPKDLVYLDPPWQGTSEGPHKRYHQGLSRERLVGVLRDLNHRRVPFILSYDGRCGDRQYGRPLPTDLDLVHLELDAGRSSQATLVGRAENTVESLYISSALVATRARASSATRRPSAPARGAAPRAVAPASPGPRLRAPCPRSRWSAEGR